MIDEVLAEYWGFDSLRPIQSEIIRGILEGHDSLTVLPTGGGKSLCYQLPAMCLPGLTVVVSPLIALMKDQVDALRELGIPAATINSSLGASERRQIAGQVRSGQTKLLYMSPERLLADKTLDFFANQRIAFIAIDEAHCISSWGHDFRPDYRALGALRERLPEIPLHAFTATATPQVQDDVIHELRLRAPLKHVGDFHRSNLKYHVVRRQGGLNQICSLLEGFDGESGIIYCLTRAEVERTSHQLNELGYSTLPYHAGMSDQQRAAGQEDFLTEQVKVIVATVAFGMGIDKSNVRFVIHAGMPRALENYQQESGRAGRDGLEAHCWLLYSPRDLITWQRIIDEPLEGTPEEAVQAAKRSLDQMYQFCISVSCRHQSLCAHFGQDLELDASGRGCGSCDVCLGELQVTEDALVIAQKILSCVLRVDQRFGANHVTQVLRGSQAKAVRKFRHHKLSTWGILKSYPAHQVREWTEQLIGQGYLVKVSEYQQLRVTTAGREVLRGQRVPRLLQGAATGGDRAAHSQTPAQLLDSWEGVDQGLFEALRELRSQAAHAARIPAYCIFSDVTLRDMARRRPSSVEQFLGVHGVGNHKSETHGAKFLETITTYCRAQGMTMDVRSDSEECESTGVWPDRENVQAGTKSASRALPAFPYFRRGIGLRKVADQLGRAVSTVEDYLIEYIRQEKVQDISAWVAPEDIARIEIALDYALLDNPQPLRLKPIYESLNGCVEYGAIKAVLACREQRVE